MSIFNSNVKSNVNIGTAANDGTGDPLRDAFEKVNNNFFDLYVFLGNGTHLGNVTRINILGGNLTGVANISTANTIFTGNLSTPAIFHNSGTVDIKNNLNVTGDLDIDGGAITFSTSQANIASTSTTVRIGAAATTLDLGAASGTTTVKNDLSITGSVLGNINAGNISVTTAVATRGDIGGLNLLAGNIAGTTGYFTGNIVVLGNVISGNLSGTDARFVTSTFTSNVNTGNTSGTDARFVTATFTSNVSTGNITTSAINASRGNIGGLSLVSGNITGTSGYFTGNIVAGNLISSGVLTIIGTQEITGNITAYNLNLEGAPQQGGSVVASVQGRFSGNVNTGNIQGTRGYFSNISGRFDEGSISSGVTFPTTGVIAASYGNSTHHIGLVIDTYGRITSANTIALAAGPQGPQGFQGAQGNQGFQGAQGNQGFQGAQGNQGFQGAQGNQGFQGSTGSQGPQGFQGDTGAQGPQGFQGATGSQGPQGFQGVAGSSSGGSFANVSSIVGQAVTTTTSNIFTAPSTPVDSRYIVYSLYVTNVDANQTSSGDITATLGGENYSVNSLATTVPVPVGSAVELLKKPKIMKSGDYLQVAADANSILHASLTYQTIYTDNTYFGSGVDITAAGTYTNLYVATGNAVSIESILLVNDDGTNDIKADVVYTDGSDNIVGYYSYKLIVPADATIELLEAPKYLPLNYKIKVLANQADRLEAVIAGRKL